MSRVSISISSSSIKNPTENRNYSVSFNGDFDKVLEGVNKLYDTFKLKVK